MTEKQIKAIEILKKIKANIHPRDGMCSMQECNVITIPEPDRTRYRAECEKYREGFLEAQEKWSKLIEKAIGEIANL